MPTLLADYHGRATWLAAYGISVFFALRAAGRFLGAWMLMRLRWPGAVAVLSGAILLCFALSLAKGVDWAIFQSGVRPVHVRDLPDDQFERHQLRAKSRAWRRRRRHPVLHVRLRGARPPGHGRRERRDGTHYLGFWLDGFAGVLFAGLLLNWLTDPTRAVLERLDLAEYKPELST